MLWVQFEILRGHVNKSFIHIEKKKLALMFTPVIQTYVSEGCTLEIFVMYMWSMLSYNERTLSETDYLQSSSLNFFQSHRVSSQIQLFRICCRADYVFVSNNPFIISARNIPLCIVLGHFKRSVCLQIATFRNTSLSVKNNIVLFIFSDPTKCRRNPLIE